MAVYYFFESEWVVFQVTSIGHDRWGCRSRLTNRILQKIKLQTLDKQMCRNVRKRTFWHVRSTKTKQPLYSRCLITVFVVRMKKLCTLGCPKRAQWRFWSDCANAQADLNLRWAHVSCFRTFRLVCRLSSVQTVFTIGPVSRVYVCYS